MKILLTQLALEMLICLFYFEDNVSTNQIRQLQQTPIKQQYVQLDNKALLYSLMILQHKPISKKIKGT